VAATSPAGTTTSPDETFVFEPATAPSGAGCTNTQFRTGPVANLPDCRAYEQVSPVDKNGYDAEAPAGAVAVDGASIAWTSKGTFAGQPSNAGLSSPYLSTRDGSAWSTEGIAPKFSTQGSNGSAFTFYVGWSADLQHMVVAVLVFGESPQYYLRNPDGSFTLLDPNETAGTTTFPQYVGASPDFSQILFINEKWAGGTLGPQVPTAVASRCTTGKTGQAGPGGNCGTASVSVAPSAFVNAQGFLTSTAYFISNEELTNDANTGPTGAGKDLYEYDAQTGALTDLSPDTNPADATGAQVNGVVGASSDGSYVYFVASGALTSGASPGGTGLKALLNLYVWHDGAVRLIAQLTHSDQGDWAFPQNNASAQMLADGTQLLFTSTASPTGYDNAGFREIYRYDATSGRPSCVSCDPSGAAATGNAELSRGYTSTALPEQANISADGSRVFFDTPDALVPQDTNGQQDAYEWEADGTGSCQSATDSGGCLYLLSTGQSATPSYFAGANPSGSDAFILTRDQLVGQDQDGNYDIYDARVDGGLASQEASPPPPSCSGTDCQGPASAAPPAPTAASVSFAGSGNVVPAVNPKAAAKATAKPTVLSRTVRGTTFIVRVKAPGKGRITVTGPAVRTVRHAVARAGTYRLKVTLTAKSKRELKRKRKLRLALKVGYAPAGAKAAQAAVRLTVEQAAERHATHKHGGAR